MCISQLSDGGGTLGHAFAAQGQQQCGPGHGQTHFFNPSFKRLLRENVHPVLCSLSFISSMIKVLGNCNEEIKLNAELLHNLLQTFHLSPF